MDAKLTSTRNEADKPAGAAAELHAVPEEQANNIIKRYEDFKVTQNRFIQVTKNASAKEIQ